MCSFKYGQRQNTQNIYNFDVWYIIIHDKTPEFRGNLQKKQKFVFSEVINAVII